MLGVAKTALLASNNYCRDYPRTCLSDEDGKEMDASNGRCGLSVNIEQRGTQNMQNRDYPMERSFCGAKTRSGRPCRQTPMPNGRCRFHGGLSLTGKDHGRYKRGEFTKDALQNRRQIRALRRRAKKGQLKPPDVYTITNHIPRCGCQGDHLIIAETLWFCRAALDSKFAPGKLTNVSQTGRD